VREGKPSRTAAGHKVDHGALSISCIKYQPDGAATEGMLKGRPAEPRPAGEPSTGAAAEGSADGLCVKAGKARTATAAARNVIHPATGHAT